MRTCTVLLLLGCAVACGGEVRTSPGTDASAGSDASADASAADVEAGTPDSGGADVATHDGSTGCPASMPVPGTCDTNGLSCTYPGGPCTCTSGCSPGECCPQSCAMLSFPCAPAGDSCGGVLHCRDCPAGQACGKDGVCGAPADAGCFPAGCPAAACGMIDDGCGGRIDCGGCYWSCVLSGP